MRKRLTGSALLALTVLATAAIGQPPPAPSAPKADNKKVEKKPADPTDDAIAAALANDPDVKMARAKIQLAEAELAKARLAVAQKVTALKAMIDLHKAAVEVAAKQVEFLEQRSNTAGVPVARLDARLALSKAQAALAAAEAELKLLTGPADGSASGNDPARPHTATEMALREVEEQLRLRIQAVQGLSERKTIEGPIPDRIRAALDKPVKLGPKGQEVTFTQALEAFKKEAGLDVSVRGTLPEKVVDNPKNPREVELRPAAIDSDGETLPVGAWLQMFEDQYRVQFYVREYGLLISRRESAPKDAPTLTEFWKQKPAKEPKRELPPNK